jgi:type VI secretion system protein ImpM
MGLFWNKKKDAPAVVGLYGKHPAAGDFLRYNANSPHLNSLDEWLSAALPAAQRLIPDWETFYLSAPRISFVYQDIAAKSSRCVIGSMIASNDQSGRQFPLMIFAEIDQRMVFENYPALPHLRFFQDVNRVLAGVADLDRESLARSVDQLVAPEQPPMDDAIQAYDSFLDNTDCGSTFSTMFGLAAVSQTPKALGTLKEACAPVGSGQGLPRFGIRCPLGNDGEGGAALWLGLFQQMLPVPILPNVIWTDRTMLIYFNKFTSKSLSALWREDWQDATLCDLSTAESGEDRVAPVNLSDPLRKLFEGQG